MNLPKSSVSAGMPWTGRKFFWARRQPLPWGGSGLSPGDSGYSADDGTVPTPWKDSLFLFLMGAAPLLVTGRVLKRRLEKAG